MALFPTELTNAVAGVTDALAEQLNNVEGKIGIDNSAVVTSLDYLVKNPASVDPGHKHTNPYKTVGTDSTADYVCDGVADDVQIQAAIDAVYAAGGGTVFIKEGTFLASTNIEYKDNVHIVGAGRGVTIIKQADGANLTGSLGLIQQVGYCDYAYVWMTTTRRLLLHFDGDDEATGVTNYGMDTGTITFAGNAQLDTSQYKFPNALSSPTKTFSEASLLLNGTTDYLTIPDSTSWTFGTEDFTIDLQVRFANFDPGAAYVFVDHSQDNNNRWVFLESDSNLIFENWVGGTKTINVEVAWTPVVDTWYHVALIRTGDDFKIFVNGTQVGSTVTDTSPVDDNTGLLRIGCSLYNGVNVGFMDGWIDELRIVNGTAEWTTDFTAPTVPYFPPIITAKNVSISHLSVDGNMANNNTPRTYLIGIIMLDVIDGVLDDVEVYNCSEAGINAQSTDFYSPSITSDTVQGVSVRNCIAHDNFDAGFAVVSGVFVNNTSYNNHGDGFIITAASSTGWNSIASFIGCSAYNNYRGFVTDYQSTTYSFPVVLDGCIARNNYWGIEVKLKDTSIKNCEVIYNQTDGISLYADHARVSGNTIKNNGHGPFASGGSGIEIVGNLSDLAIMDNDIYDDQTTKTQEYGIVQVGTTTLTRVKIKDNNLYGNKTLDIDAQIAIAGADVSDNY